MTTLFCISVALAAGLLMSRPAKLLKLPAVTGYLISGVLIGPYCLGRLGIEGLGFVSMESLESLNIISEVALGFIAFSIGNEFRLSQLKETGKQATVISIVQALTATLFVDVSLFVTHLILGEDKLPLAVVIVLGAIATATAPAATLMVVRQYKAKGKLTDLLLPIVALDDAVGLIVFAVSFGIAKALKSGQVDMVSIIVEPLLEVVCSLVLGALVGLLFTFTETFFHSNSKRLAISITFVILTVALSKLNFSIGNVNIGFSSLLTCMMLGSVFCNVCETSEEIMERADKWSGPLLVLFFVISGAELELSVFTKLSVVAVGAIYIIFRSAGKYIGAFASAKATKCDDNICKYLGITLLPQAGVSLGMTITAMQLGEEEGSFIRNIVLFSVLIYELVGPLLTRIALTKAGDISPKEFGKTARRVKPKA